MAEWVTGLDPTIKASVINRSGIADTLPKTLCKTSQMITKYHVSESMLLLVMSKKGWLMMCKLLLLIVAFVRERSMP